MQSRFADVDKNSDGSLDKSEFAAAMAAKKAVGEDAGRVKGDRPGKPGAGGGKKPGSAQDAGAGGERKPAGAASGGRP